MDIEYLLLLQNFRNGIHDALTPFMEGISFFGITYILLFPVFVYWCLDKRKGIMIFAALKISQTFNAMIKLTACVYRPWIKDPRVIPAGNAITTATGYSFPSGHTMMVTPIYGGLAMLTKKRIYRAFWILLILITAFSRNYLGVHTPQDVLVGLVIGPISLYIAVKILDYIDDYPERLGVVMFVLGAMGVLTLFYVMFKSYPMDYVDGKLLVDPDKMTRDSWGDAGGLAVFALMNYIEQRYVKFSSTGWNVKGVIISVIGLFPLCWIIGNLEGILSGFFNPHVRKLVFQIILFFYVMILWPLVMKLFVKPFGNSRER